MHNNMFPRGSSNLRLLGEKPWEQGENSIQMLQSWATLVGSERSHYYISLPHNYCY